MNDDFCVAASLEPMAFLFEFRMKLLKVINLTVHDHPNGFVLVGDGLMPACHIDDAESAHPKSDSAAHIFAGVIRAAMFDHAGHTRENRLERHPTLVEIRDSVYSTHGSKLPVSRGQFSYLAKLSALWRSGMDCACVTSSRACARS